jgi:hypothetical protein
VELWRIGQSPPAPKFNVISKPNDWSRSIAQAARAIDDSELSEIRLLQRDYWASFNEALDKAGGPILGSRKPQPHSWMAYSIGRSAFHLGAVMLRPKNQIRTELYIAGDDAKAYFGLLKLQQDTIEQELSYPLEWEELPDRRDCRVSCYLSNVDPENKDDWHRQHEWLANHINDMHRVFAKKIRTLDAAAWQDKDD